MAEDKVKLTVELDDNLSAGLGRLSSTIGGLDGPMGRMQSSFSTLGSTIVVLNQGIELAQRAWAGLDATMGEILRTTDKFRRMEIQLITLTGSEEKAAEAMSFLVDLARKTPQTLETLTDGFIKLTAGGVRNAEKGMIALTNAVSAFGGSDLALKRATIAIQQMAGKGVISMEELRQQLGESIPTAMKVMARELGMSMGDMVDQISKGALDANTGIQALFDGLEEDFGGASEAMMNTWAGATSNLQDSWDQFLKALGETGILDAAIKGVRELTDGVNDLTTALNIWAGQGTFTNLEDLGAAIDTVKSRLKAARDEVWGSTEDVEKYEKQLKSLEEQYAKLTIKIQEQTKASGELSFEQAQLGTNVTQAIIVVKEAITEFGNLGIGIEGVDAASVAASQAFDDMAVASASLTTDMDGVAEAMANVTVEATNSTAAILALFDATETGGAGGGAGGGGVFGDIGAGAAAGAAGAFQGVAGVGGAMAGFQAGGPMGAAAGFITDLLMQDPEMRQAIEDISAALVELVAPIASALAPALQAIVPLIEAFAPVFDLIGRMLADIVEYLIPVIAELVRWVEDIIIFFEGFAESLNEMWADIQEFFVSLGNAIAEPFNALGQQFEGLETALGDLPNTLAAAILDALEELFSWLAEEIRDIFSISGSIGLPGVPLITPPRMHTGGNVHAENLLRTPGMAQDEGLAILQDGEQVIPRNGNGTGRINVTINGAPDQQSVNQLLRILEEQSLLGRIAL